MIKQIFLNILEGITFVYFILNELFAIEIYLCVLFQISFAFIDNITISIK